MQTNNKQTNSTNRTAGKVCQCSVLSTLSLWSLSLWVYGLWSLSLVSSNCTTAAAVCNAHPLYNYASVPRLVCCGMGHIPLFTHTPTHSYTQKTKSLPNLKPRAVYFVAFSLLSFFLFLHILDSFFLDTLTGSIRIWTRPVLETKLFIGSAYESHLICFFLLVHQFRSYWLEIFIINHLIVV